MKRFRLYGNTLLLALFTCGYLCAETQSANAPREATPPRQAKQPTTLDFEMFGEIAVNPDGSVLDCTVAGGSFELHRESSLIIQKGIERRVKAGYLPAYANKIGVFRSKAIFEVHLEEPETVNILVRLKTGDLVLPRPARFPKQASRRGWSAYLLLKVEVDHNHQILTKRTLIERALSSNGESVSNTVLIEEFSASAKTALVGAKVEGSQTLNGELIQPILVPFRFCLEDSKICDDLERKVNAGDGGAKLSNSPKIP